MPAATVTAIATTATDVQTDIRNTLDARTKLQAIHDTVTEERAAAVTDLVKQLTKDLAAPTPPTADRLFDVHKAWRAKDEHAAERLAAIDDLATKVQARVDEFKAQPALKQELANVLRLKIAVLTQSKGEVDQESETIQQQVKKLQEELDALGAPPYDAAAGAKAQKKGT